MRNGRPNLFPGSACTRLDLKVRKHHVDYLCRIAGIDDTNLSRTFGSLVERNAGRSVKDNPEPAQKARLHIQIGTEHLAIVDRLCKRWGMSRSDVARRLIDGALEKEG